MDKIVIEWTGPVCRECFGKIKILDNTGLYKCDGCSAIYSPKELKSLKVAEKK